MFKYINLKKIMNSRENKAYVCLVGFGEKREEEQDIILLWFQYILYIL